MPYKITRKGKKFLLCKENADGSAGRVIADHNTLKQATAQMRAVYASEKQARGRNYIDKQ